MKSLDYYLSIPANPFTENNATSQEDIIQDAEFAFRYDSIHETIGEPECKANIDLFYDDLMEEMDIDQKSSFFHLCIKKVMLKYHAPMLIDFLSDEYQHPDVINELRGLLEFFEGDDGVSFIAKSIPLTEPKLVLTDHLKSQLELNYGIFLKNLDRFSEEVSKLVRYNCKLASKKDTVQSLLKLITKKKFAVVSEYYLQRGVQEDD